MQDAQRKFPAAEENYKKALAAREKSLGPEAPETAVSLHNLAALYESQGRYKEAGKSRVPLPSPSQ